MIDIHCHILTKVPGDDGASNLAESIAIARRLVESGFTAVIATPHCIDGEAVQNYEALQNQVDELNAVFKQEQIFLEVSLGCEILYHNEILSRLKTGKAITLGHSKYVLIELPMREFPEEVPHLVLELVNAGYKPVIAHPERNRVISADPSLLEDLIQKGAYAQLNLCSLTNVYGDSAKLTAEALLKAEMYHLVGSDFHRANLDITQALSALEKISTKKYMNLITTQNGKKLLCDQAISHSPKEGELKPVIKLSDVKNKTKPKKNIGRTILMSIALIGLISSGVLAYADYRIQKEIETTLADAGINMDEDFSLESLINGTAANVTGTTSAGEPNASVAGTTQNVAGQPVGTSATGNSTSTAESTTGNVKETSGEAKASTDTGSASSLKKLTLAEKAHAYSIVMGKLNPELVSHLKGLAADGFTSAEKQEIKNIFYTNFTAEEQSFLMNLYKKGK